MGALQDVGSCSKRYAGEVVREVKGMNGQVTKANVFAVGDLRISVRASPLPQHTAE